jgi:hypothetical protein
MVIAEIPVTSKFMAVPSCFSMLLGVSVLQKQLCNEPSEQIKYVVCIVVVGHHHQGFTTTDMNEIVPVKMAVSRNRQLSSVIIIATGSQGASRGTVEV